LDLSQCYPTQQSDPIQVRIFARFFTLLPRRRSISCTGEKFALTPTRC
jgi:hypothetical protein